MLEKLKLADFLPLVGSTITAHVGEGVVPLSVEKARDLSRGEVSADRRAPFSVWFTGPADPVLPQRIYPMDCGPLGTFEIFIVPIGRVESGIRYEAIFN